MNDPSVNAIAVDGLAKRFEEVQAVADASFDLLQGELFGFLGPNGAGKTTTINMLTGLARPDAGTIRIAGIDCTGNPKAAQHLTGVVPDESNLYPELTGFDNLCFCAALYGMKKTEREARAHELLETFGLADAANRKFAGYSRGMKRKLTIAAGIIHHPPILFLDEPTVGVDPELRASFWDYFQDLSKRGITVVITTHYMDEAHRCNKIGMLRHGQLIAEGSPAEIIQATECQSLEEAFLVLARREGYSEIS